MSVPAPGGGGASVPASTKSPPMPAVRFSTTSVALSWMRSVTAR
jgi:hypothetical protein